MFYFNSWELEKKQFNFDNYSSGKKKKYLNSIIIIHFLATSFDFFTLIGNLKYTERNFNVFKNFLVLTENFYFRLQKREIFFWGWKILFTTLKNFIFIPYDTKISLSEKLRLRLSYKLAGNKKKLQKSFW